MTLTQCLVSFALGNEQAANVFEVYAYKRLDGEYVWVAGSAVLLASPRVLVTCYHIVSGATRLVAVDSDGSCAQWRDPELENMLPTRVKCTSSSALTLLASFSEADLAVLEIESGFGIGDGVSIRESGLWPELVVPLANPLGFDRTQGAESPLVSLRSANWLSDYFHGYTLRIPLLQYGGQATYGSSGGALLDMDGRLAGIIVGGLKQGSVDISLAIPSNIVASCIEQTEELRRATEMSGGGEHDTKKADWMFSMVYDRYWDRNPVGWWGGLSVMTRPEYAGFERHTAFAAEFAWGVLRRYGMGLGAARVKQTVDVSRAGIAASAKQTTRQVFAYGRMVQPWARAGDTNLGLVGKLLLAATSDEESTAFTSSLFTPTSASERGLVADFSVGGSAALEARGWYANVSLTFGPQFESSLWGDATTWSARADLFVGVGPTRRSFPE